MGAVTVYILVALPFCANFTMPYFGEWYLKLLLLEIDKTAQILKASKKRVQNIYIGGGMAANNPIEFCDGTIHSVQFFDRVLTGEQIASIKYTSLTSTSIKEFEAAESKENTIFDLQGRRLEKITQGGIYIVNGNKIIVK